MNDLAPTFTSDMYISSNAITEPAKICPKQITAAKFCNFLGAEVSL